MFRLATEWLKRAILELQDYMRLVGCSHRAVRAIYGRDIVEQLDAIGIDRLTVVFPPGTFTAWCSLCIGDALIVARVRRRPLLSASMVKGGPVLRPEVTVLASPASRRSSAMMGRIDRGASGVARIRSPAWSCRASWPARSCPSSPSGRTLGLLGGATLEVQRASPQRTLQRCRRLYARTSDGIQQRREGSRSSARVYSPAGKGGTRVGRATTNAV